MRRARAGAVALAAVGVLAPQAQAAPVAYDARFLEAELRLIGSDGADWRLHLHGTQLGSARTETPTSSDPQALHVTAQRGAGDLCRPAGSWRVELTDDQIEVAEDSTSARVDAVLFGRRLSVALTPSGLETGTVRLVAGGASAAPGEGYLDVSRSVHAQGRVVLDALACAGTSAVIGQAVVVAEESAPPTGDQVAPVGLLDGPVRCQT